MVHGFINFINLAQSAGVKLNQLTTWRPVPVGWVPTWPVFLLGHPRNPQGNLQENPWNSLLKKTSVSYSLVNGYTYIYIYRYDTHVVFNANMIIYALIISTDTGFFDVTYIYNMDKCPWFCCMFSLPACHLDGSTCRTWSLYIILTYIRANRSFH